MDGLEYTFQVNYLSHLLINEVILRDIKGDRPVKIATVTSPVFRLADTDLNIQAGAKAYSAMKSYSSSKLYLTLMSEFLPLRYSNLNLCSFSFDPGTFSSGIYRMQKEWFRDVYRIASVFMRSPAKVANVLKDLLIREDAENGMIYYKTKHSRPVPVIDQKKKDGFINASYDLIDPFLNLVNN